MQTSNGIKSKIRKRYEQAAQTAEGFFNYPVGKAGALALGYNPYMIDAAPEEMVQSFCGVGNPFTLGHVIPDSFLLDVGCGSGFDLFCASYAVGPLGKVFGIDLTPAMVKRAESGLEKGGRENAEVKTGDAENLPFEENTFDIVISNGTLNLIPDKERALSEIFRVLEPGGYFLCADMVREEDAPPAEEESRDWAE